MLTALIICATLVFLALRAEHFFGKLIGLKEQALRPLQTPPKADPMPQYLWLQAMSESEQWARDEAMKRYNQLYEEHGDWSKVQAVVAPSMARG